MTAIESILGLLEERAIARDVTNKHDEARVRFPLTRNTVDTFEDFTVLVSEYYNHHYCSCVSNGGRLAPSDAWGSAREALEREYRRRSGDIVSAFNDAHAGTNGGARVILDTLAEALKAKDLDNYVRYVFDCHVTPNSWEEKVEIIRSFIERCGIDLSSSIDVNHPERYAHDYVYLIHAYVNGLRQTSSAFRRL